MLKIEKIEVEDMESNFKTEITEKDWENDCFSVDKTEISEEKDCKSNCITLDETRILEVKDCKSCTTADKIKLSNTPPIDNQERKKVLSQVKLELEEVDFSISEKEFEQQTARDRNQELCAKNNGNYDISKAKSLLSSKNNKSKKSNGLTDSSINSKCTVCSEASSQNENASETASSPNVSSGKIGDEKSNIVAGSNKTNESPKSYCCKRCNVKTDTWSEFANHLTVSSESDRKIFNCCQCSYRNGALENLKRHYANKHSQSIILDSTIDTLDKNGCSKHSKHNNNQHTQDLSVNFENKARQPPADTNDSHNANLKWFFCANCDYKTRQRRNILEHMNFRHNERSQKFECTRCDFKTFHKGLWNRHLKMQHENPGKVIHCTMCSFMTNRNEGLKHHFYKTHYELAKVFRCDWCGYETKARAMMERHFKRTKGKAEIHRCRQCDFSSVYRLCLFTHLKIYCPGNLEWLRCESCTFKTRYRRSLNRHRLFKHTEKERSFECHRCDFKTKCKEYLVKHFRNKHNENVSWVRCTQCDYKTKYNNHLGRHVKRKHRRE